jgi:hypothetical protein
VSKFKKIKLHSEPLVTTVCKTYAQVYFIAFPIDFKEEGYHLGYIILRTGDVLHNLCDSITSTLSAEYTALKYCYIHLKCFSFSSLPNNPGSHKVQLFK